MCSLFPAELDLLIARLILASAIRQLIEGNFLTVGSLWVGKDRIRRDGFVTNLRKTEIASVTAVLYKRSIVSHRAG